MSRATRMKSRAVAKNTDVGPAPASFNAPPIPPALDALLTQVALPSRDAPREFRSSLTKVTPATLRPPFQTLSKRLDASVAALHNIAQISLPDSLNLQENSSNIVYLTGRVDRMESEFVKYNKLDLPTTIPSLQEKLTTTDGSIRHLIESTTRRLDSRIGDLEMEMEKTINRNHTEIKNRLAKMRDDDGSGNERLMKAESQSRHALEEIRMLTDRFNKRGREQLEELEKMTLTQVSLYLTGIATDITNLTKKVDELTESKENQNKKIKWVEKESENTYRMIAGDVCRLVNDIQGNRDAIALMELNTAGMREKLIALKARKNLAMHTGPMLNEELSKQIGKYFPSQEIEESTAIFEKHCKKCEVGEVETLRKEIKTMKDEQKVMMKAVEESIQRVQTIADLAIEGFKKSEKKTANQLGDFRKMLLSFSEQLNLIMEVYSKQHAKR